MVLYQLGAHPHWQLIKNHSPIPVSHLSTTHNTLIFQAQWLEMAGLCHYPWRTYLAYTWQVAIDKHTSLLTDQSSLKSRVMLKVCLVCKRDMCVILSRLQRHAPEDKDMCLHVSIRNLGYSPWAKFHSHESCLGAVLGNWDNVSSLCVDFSITAVWWLWEVSLERTMLRTWVQWDLDIHFKIINNSVQGTVIHYTSCKETCCPSYRVQMGADAALLAERALHIIKVSKI